MTYSLQSNQKKNLTLSTAVYNSYQGSVTGFKGFALVLDTYTPTLTSPKEDSGLKYTAAHLACVVAQAQHSSMICPLQLLKNNVHFKDVLGLKFQLALADLGEL